MSGGITCSHSASIAMKIGIRSYWSKVLEQVASIRFLAGLPDSSDAAIRRWRGAPSFCLHC